VKAVFFTDLDGTLLDHDTYSYDLSIEGIKLLHRHLIPLIPVSSKTFEEMNGLMTELGLGSPFAFENGSGIAFPGSGHDYNVEITGPGIEQLQKFFPELERISGRKCISLLSIPDDEIVRITGLDRVRAVLSIKRISSLPFIMQDEHLLPDSEIQEINTELTAYNLHVTKGGRFNHLVPLPSGKDYAIKKIIEFYRDKYNDEIITGAAGDSMNDLPMLDCVDHSYIIRKKDGSFIAGAKGKVMEKNGPAGFTLAVEDFLGKVTD